MRDDGSRSRISALDACLLEVETATAHMHFGWVAAFDPPEERQAPTFQALRRHVAARLGRTPRYRQKLAFVPFGLHDPVWVDDPEFDITRHVLHSPATDLDGLVEQVFSAPLNREHPLWELWIADRLDGERLAVVGKVHHCMVDGVAAVELASLLLDPERESPEVGIEGWRPAPSPSRLAVLGEAVRDRLSEEFDLVRLPARVARSPRRIAGAARDSGRAARALVHSFGSPAPRSVLNQPISPLRSLARVQVPVSELRDIRRRHGVTVNDLVLAVSAGAMRRYLGQHGETPLNLKAMVPLSVGNEREAPDPAAPVSCLFVELPCEEPDAARRLEDIHMAMSDRRDSGEPRGAQAVLEAIRFAPHPLQHALSHAVAAPRTFNVVVSNVPGPRQPLFMMGCPLREAYPIVPLAERHGVAIGFTRVGDTGFFGIYADRLTIPDITLLARDVEESIAELREAQPASTRYAMDGGMPPPSSTAGASAAP